MKLIIKHEEEKDFNQIHHFIEDAFKTADISDGDEQNFVNTLRQSENYIPELALVAFDDNQLVGHIMLTKFATEKMLLLAPLTVDIHYRGQGIGTMLVKKAFELAKEMNYTSVIVLGAPSYYSRFGFKPSTINVQFLRKIFHVMKIHLSYAIFNSSKMVFNSTPFWALR